MTLTEDWLPFEEQYNNDNILTCPSVFYDVRAAPSIHPKFFNDTINNSRGCPNINEDPIFRHLDIPPHHSLTFHKNKNGNVDNSIENYDALWCKFGHIRIYNSAGYFRIDNSNTL